MTLDHEDLQRARREGATLGAPAQVQVSWDVQGAVGLGLLLPAAASGWGLCVTPCGRRQAESPMA